MPAFKAIAYGFSACFRLKCSTEKNGLTSGSLLEEDFYLFNILFPLTMRKYLFLEELTKTKKVGRSKSTIRNTKMSTFLEIYYLKAWVLKEIVGLKLCMGALLHFPAFKLRCILKLGWFLIWQELFIFLKILLFWTLSLLCEEKDMIFKVYIWDIIILERWDDKLWTVIISHLLWWPR